MSASNGDRVGPYVVVRLIGSGGMGNVFEARHGLLGRRVAIKMMHARVAADPVATARFLREGQAAARIRHPGVVEVFDIGTCGNVPYLVMELVDGVDLATHLRQRGPLPVSAAADCVLDVLAGITAAHDAGVVHRDLKPANVRLATNYLGEQQVKILDFGISKIRAVSSDLTDSNQILGTTHYMAPEQLRSPSISDEQSDVYALGVLLYECLTGRLPFQGASAYERMHAILTAPLAPPRLLRPGIPSELERVVLRALDRDREARFATSREFARALLPFASSPSSRSREFAERAAPVRKIEHGTNDGRMPAAMVATLPSISIGVRRDRRPWLLAFAVAVTLLGASSFVVGGGRVRRGDLPADLRGAPTAEREQSLAAPAPTTVVPLASASALVAPGRSAASQPTPVVGEAGSTLERAREARPVPARPAAAPPPAILAVPSARTDLYNQM